MAREIEWPYETVALEYNCDGGPDTYVIPREMVPDPSCENCTHRYLEVCELNEDRNTEDDPEACDDYEWDEDTFLEEPRNPRREEYSTARNYQRACNAVWEWRRRYGKRDRDE